MENACTDCPRIFDYSFEEVFGNDTRTTRFPVEKLTVLNQSLQRVMRMSCTRMAMAHITNGQNILEGTGQDTLLAEKMWLEYLKKDQQAERLGATLQSSLDQFKNEGYISGYVTVRKVEEAKKAIDAGRFIFTGSQNGDWLSVRNQKIYRLRTDGRVVGHAFCIVGYDDKSFICLNSFGKQNGYFNLPYNLFNTLFTRYAIADKIDEQKIINHKNLMDEKDLQEAQKLGIFNGKDGERPVTRREMVLMIMRAMRLLKQ